MDYKRGRLIWIYHRWSPQMTASNISTSVCQCRGRGFTEKNAHKISIIFWVYFQPLCKKKKGDSNVCSRCIMLLIFHPCISFSFSSAAYVSCNYSLKKSSSARIVSEQVFSGLYMYAKLHFQDHFTVAFDSLNTSMYFKSGEIRLYLLQQHPPAEKVS